MPGFDTRNWYEREKSMKRRTVRAEQRKIKKAAMARGRKLPQVLDPEYERERQEILDAYLGKEKDELQRPIYP